METQTELLVRGNEGVSEGAAAPEVPTDADIAAIAVADATGTPFVNPDSTVEGAVPEVIPGESEAGGTPPVEPDQAQEGLPPELRNDKDGNPPQLTEGLLRKLRGRYFTVRHPFLVDCGHKLDMINQPKNNCDNCWFQFFNTHGELVKVADQFYRTHGKGAMVSMRGEKFVKNFGRFMVTVLAMKQEEADVVSNPEGSNIGSVNGDEASGQAGEGRQADSPADEQGRQAESRGISSGLIEQTVRD
jgi:hypothetical protein